jgi:hypothetical protein
VTKEIRFFQKIGFLATKEIRFFQKACRPGPGPDDRRDQRELRELIEGSDF